MSHASRARHTRVAQSIQRRGQCTFAVTGGPGGGGGRGVSEKAAHSQNPSVPPPPPPLLPLLLLLLLLLLAAGEHLLDMAERSRPSATKPSLRICVFGIRGTLVDAGCGCRQGCMNEPATGQQGQALAWPKDVSRQNCRFGVIGRQRDNSSSAHWCPHVRTAGARLASARSSDRVKQDLMRAL